MAALNWFGLSLTVIPFITILGNALVIISVLRFRALHSAINFLILGLAVADLLVALFVMPYAVYVYVYNGEWFLGNLACDLYMACDVACSTASILLLAVISFDRFRAVSRPIQYSRTSQNIKRVVVIIVIVWLISLTIASPMVFGINLRPPDANPYECRFYNAEFSIASSMVSFLVPCFLVLFVYIRIILALKKREQAARERRLTNATACSLRDATLAHSGSKRARTSSEGEEAGRIVAGPVVNVMMLALPSMTQRMRQYERHRRALEAAGEEEELDIDDDVELGDRDATALADDDAPRPRRGTEPTPARLRRFLAAAARGRQAGRLSLAKEHEFGGSSTPRSSIDDSLSDNGQVLANDFVSEGYTTQSRRSSEMCEISQNIPSSSLSSDKSQQRKSNKFMHLRTSTRRRRRSFTFPAEHRQEAQNGHSSHSSQRILPAILRQLSRRSPRLFRSATTSKSHSPVGAENKYRREDSEHERPLTALTETETISASLPRCVPAWLRQAVELHAQMDDERSEADGTVIANINFSRSTTVNSGELFDSGLSHDPRSSLILENSHAIAQRQIYEEEERETPREQDRDATPPTVTFSNTVHKMSVSQSREETLKPENNSTDKKLRRPSSAEEAIVAVKILTHSQLPGEEPPLVSHRPATRTESTSTEGGRSLKKQNSKNGGLAVRLVKKTLKHDQSLKRKVSKNQRKEKRATKTLGIVVGIFLICWVPFFTMNIVNGICVLLNEVRCQVGFDGFFYSTWLGYMNSFMNPVIYTIFNTEFRRAFKSLLFGRHQQNGAATRTMLGVRV